MERLGRGPPGGRTLPGGWHAGFARKGNVCLTFLRAGGRIRKGSGHGFAGAEARCPGGIPGRETKTKRFMDFELKKFWMRRFADLAILLLVVFLGVFSGELVSYFAKSCFPFREVTPFAVAPWSAGWADDAAFASWRRIGLAVLAAVAIAGVYICRTLKPSLRTLRGFLFFAAFAWAVVTTAVFPEISPMQFVWEGRPASTVYAPGFDRDVFLSLPAGTTKEEVAAAIGLGFEGDFERDTWFFSEAGRSENYWQYYLKFSPEGVLAAKVAIFWWD